MQPTATDSPQSIPPTAAISELPESRPSVPRATPGSLRNFIVLALYQMVTRTGWIFKTESIVMPAVLDSIAGAGWIRGWLPLLNRFGNSVPPLLMARRVTVAARKKWILLTSTALMAGLFLMLGMLFTPWGSLLGGWLPLTYLTLYTFFFMCIGVNQLAFNTLQGKLIPVTSRGRLLLVSNVCGAVTAVLCAFLLLPGWLEESAPRFDLIFVFSGMLFTGSAIATWFLVEPADSHQLPAQSVRRMAVDVVSVWREDANFRRLTIVGGLFSVSIMLFPHYQNLGLQGMHLELKSLMWWVIIQNLGTGLSSIPVGRMADRHGNRRVLLFMLLGIASAPLSAIVLRSLPVWGGTLFPLVFVFVGLTPVVIRTLQNFALELCPAEEHPRYLATLGLLMSVPMFLSPLVGWLIDAVGFQIVFSTVAGLVLLAWLLAFGLHEPRKHVNVSFIEAVD